MFVTADQLFAHLVGDYVLQSDWMATAKTNKWSAAIVHVLVYGLPWLFLTRSPAALAIIVGTHFIIDRWRLARHVGWFKNHLAPKSAWPPPFEDCAVTGYPADKPPFMAVWLMILVDQVMHIGCNALAMRYFG
jgi:hypothetical protein